MTGASTGSAFGYSVSLSSDGNTAAVGAFAWNSNTGYVQIYSYNGSSWVTKGSQINGQPNFTFGFSVSLSGDGNVFAVGSQFAGSANGIAQIYEYNGSSWVSNVSFSGASTSRFGTSISLSTDGNTVAIGGPSFDSSRGYISIYKRNGSSWTENYYLQAAEQQSSLGSSVSLSSNGNIIAIGASGSKTVQIREYNGSSWIQRGGDLLGGDGINNFGKSVSLSSNGSIVSVGAPLANSNKGFVKNYQYDGTSYTQIGTTVEGVSVGDDFGTSVSLSSTGSYFASGAPAATTNTGYVKIQGTINAYPSNPAIGQIFFSSTENKLYIWNGTLWKSVVFT